MPVFITMFGGAYTVFILVITSFVNRRSWNSRIDATERQAKADVQSLKVVADAKVDALSVQTKADIEKSRAEQDRAIFEQWKEQRGLIDDANSKVAAANATNDALQTQLANLTEGNRARDKDQGEVKALNQSALREIDSLKADVKTLTEANSTLAANDEIAAALHSADTDQIVALTTQVTAQNGRIATLTDTVTAQNVEIADLKGEVKTLNKQLTVANDQLTEMLKKLDAANQRVSKAEADASHATNVKADAEAAGGVAVGAAPDSETQGNGGDAYNKLLDRATRQDQTILALTAKTKQQDAILNPDLPKKEN